MVVQMIGVGEATGALDTMLSKIADFYEEEVDVAVAGLLTLLEPIMIALLGGIVGGIVIAMYMPIFALISKLTGADPHMSLRSRLSTLIAVRVVVGTLLLGSAILIQLSRPGALPGRSIFRPDRRHLRGEHRCTSRRSISWIADPGWPIRTSAPMPCSSPAFIRRDGWHHQRHFSSLYLLPIIAASTIRFRRGALQVAALSVLPVRRPRVGAVPRCAALLFRLGSRSCRALPTIRFAQYTIGINLFGFFAVALLSGSLAENLRRRAPASSRRRPSSPTCARSMSTSSTAC